VLGTLDNKPTKLLSVKIAKIYKSYLDVLAGPLSYLPAQLSYLGGLLLMGWRKVQGQQMTQPGRCHARSTLLPLRRLLPL